jgi:hypothetical protein
MKSNYIHPPDHIPSLVPSSGTLTLPARFRLDANVVGLILLVLAVLSDPRVLLSHNLKCDRPEPAFLRADVRILQNEITHLAENGVDLKLCALNIIVSNLPFTSERMKERENLK